MHYDPDVRYHAWEEVEGSGVSRLVVPSGWLYWYRGTMTYVPLPPRQLNKIGQEEE